MRNRHNPKSWQQITKEIISRAKESNNPTAVVLQHEYGLDLDEQGRGDGYGRNFINMASGSMSCTWSAGNVIRILSKPTAAHTIVNSWLRLIKPLKNQI